jgi:protein TonB
MEIGAGGPTRTGDLLITNQLLYQLSYTSTTRFRRADYSIALVDPALYDVFSSRRLALAFAASLALHLALVLWPEQVPHRETAAPLLARLAARPEPAPPPRPKAPTAPRKRAAAAPAPAAASPGAPVRPRRLPSTIALPAEGEASEQMEAEKLDERQRRVPRSVSLEAPAAPREPIAVRYPPEALAAGIAGHVLLEAIIGANGRAQEIIVLEDFERPQLARAAAEAVRRARFEPARQGGRAVRSRVALRVEFTFE